VSDRDRECTAFVPAVRRGDNRYPAHRRVAS
jgi:hypothetical protein